MYIYNVVAAIKSCQFFSQRKCNQKQYFNNNSMERKNLKNDAFLGKMYKLLMAQWEKFVVIDK